ncbi:DUF6037 family protein [uncultured Photobacterium sp.]|uniref:DUF6037 family protein n=1 Tax=uncultured Photobacterium sp. TaxID=173973 RepID=UPI002617273A|nr:DUF6037 family protein [uncultured Photobacterium sp.]
MNIFENFRTLKIDMEEKGWVIEAFLFSYKNIDYICLVKLYQENDVKENQYALLRVEFLKVHNIEDNLIIPANARGFITNAQTLREYFGIQWSDNIGDILHQFNENFSRFIPDKVNSSKDEWVKVAMVKSLSESDSQNPSRIYCYSVRRNSGGGIRSIFNDNKSRLLKPDLYQKFKDDHTVSFCYSSESEREKSDTEIIRNFSHK